MSSIQQAFNSMLNSAAFAARLSPGYEDRVAGVSAAKKAGAAAKGLEDIASNLRDPNRNYSEIELKDIESRVAEHNRNVYDAKTMALSNPYAAAALEREELPERSKSYTPMLHDIEASLKQRFESLKGQKEGLADRKKIMEENKEAHRARLIQEMKDRSARAENKEKALKEVLPKGGM